MGIPPNWGYSPDFVGSDVVTSYSFNYRITVPYRDGSDGISTNQTNWFRHYMSDILTSTTRSSTPTVIIPPILVIGVIPSTTPIR